jgi:hypothetical protein
MTFWQAIHHAIAKLMNLDDEDLDEQEPETPIY